MDDEKKKLEDAEKRTRRFFNGSWRAYELKDLPGPDEMSFSRIKRSENTFRENYVVNTEFLFPSPLFLSWHLTVCKKPKKNRKSPRKSPRRSEEEKNDQKPSSFKFALYAGAGKEREKSLLFCNRTLPSKIREHLVEGLGCSEIEHYGLSGSSPPQLLKLHLDAKRKTLNFEGMHPEQFTNFSILGSPDQPSGKENSSVFKKIGSVENLHLPVIRSCQVEFSEPSLDYYAKSKIQKLKNWNFSSVDMEVQSSSLLHLYGALSEYLYQSDVPQWLSDGIRKRGKTVCKVRYNN